MRLRIVCVYLLISFTFSNCTKDKSAIPKPIIIAPPVILPPTVNKDSLAKVDYDKYLFRILDFSCNGCHDGGEFGGPGPGDFRTFSKFKIAVLRPGNPMRNRGLTDMADCSGTYGCLIPLRKDSLSNWLKDYFNL